MYIEQSLHKRLIAHIPLIITTEGSMIIPFHKDSSTSEGTRAAAPCSILLSLPLPPQGKKTSPALPSLP